MLTLNRRHMIKIGGAAAALPLLGGRALAQEKLKVGFVLIGTPDDNGWNYGHDQGRIYMLDEIGADKVETTVVTNVAEGPDAERVFRELAQQDPDILYTLGSQMAERLRQTTRKVGDLAFLDVTGRVARTLLDLCKQPDAMTHPDGMQIKITRQEIGRIVGCSREMVGRVLKALEEQGLVNVKGKTMVVFGTR